METSLTSKLEFENVDQKKRDKTVRAIAQVQSKPWTMARSKLMILPLSPSHEPQIPLESGRVGSLETKKHNFFSFFLWYPDMEKECGHSLLVFMHLLATFTGFPLMCVLCLLPKQERGETLKSARGQVFVEFSSVLKLPVLAPGNSTTALIGPVSSKERLFNSCNI